MDGLIRQSTLYLYVKTGSRTQSNFLGKDIDILPSADTCKEQRNSVWLYLCSCAQYWPWFQEQEEIIVLILMDLMIYQEWWRWAHKQPNLLKIAVAIVQGHTEEHGSRAWATGHKSKWPGEYSCLAIVSELVSLLALTIYPPE